MRPTKVWTFAEIYSITVVGGNNLTVKVLIDWACGQALYDRACLDLLAAATVLTDNEWTVSACEHERSGLERSMQSFSIVNQFADESEAVQIAVKVKAILKDLSGLP